MRRQQAATLRVRTETAEDELGAQKQMQQHHATTTQLRYDKGKEGGTSNQSSQNADNGKAHGSKGDCQYMASNPEYNQHEQDAMSCDDIRRVT